MKTHRIKPRIKKGDLVKIIAGNYKNKTGVILSLHPKQNNACIENINTYTKHLKPTRQHPKGRTITKPYPIHLSNLMLIDPATKQPTRIGRKLDQNKKWQRYAKKTGKLINS